MDQHLIQDQVRSAEQAGIRLIAVGITDEADISELRSIASSSNEVLTVSDFESLGILIADLASLTCEGPTDVDKGIVRE